jgi:GGDEF domain-containing protein
LVELANIIDKFPGFVIIAARGETAYKNETAEKLFGSDLKKADHLGIMAVEAGKSSIVTIGGAIYKIFADIVEKNGKQAKLITGFDVTDVTESAVFPEEDVFDAISEVYSSRAGMSFLTIFLSAFKAGGSVFTICVAKIKDLPKTAEIFDVDEGDTFAKVAISIIKSSIRKTDIIARIDDDKFLMIFPKCRKYIVDNIMDTVTNRFSIINDTKTTKDIIYNIEYSVLEVNDRSFVDAKHVVNIAAEAQNIT